MSSCHTIPQLPLVFIIGIAGDADQPDTVGVTQGAAEIPAVLLYEYTTRWRKCKNFCYNYERRYI